MTNPYLQVKIPSIPANPTVCWRMHRHTFLGLLAKIKCSICSLEFDNSNGGHCPPCYLTNFSGGLPNGGACTSGLSAWPRHCTTAMAEHPLHPIQTTPHSYTSCMAFHYQACVCIAAAWIIPLLFMCNFCRLHVGACTLCILVHSNALSHVFQVFSHCHKAVPLLSVPCITVQPCMSSWCRRNC